MSCIHHLYFRSNLEVESSLSSTSSSSSTSPTTSSPAASSRSPTSSRSPAGSSSPAGFADTPKFVLDLPPSEPRKDSESDSDARSTQSSSSTRVSRVLKKTFKGKAIAIVKPFSSGKAERVEGELYALKEKVSEDSSCRKRSSAARKLKLGPELKAVRVRLEKFNSKNLGKLRKSSVIKDLPPPVVAAETIAARGGGTAEEEAGGAAEPVVVFEKPAPVRNEDRADSPHRSAQRLFEYMTLMNGVNVPFVLTLGGKSK